MDFLNIYNLYKRIIILEGQVRKIMTDLSKLTNEVGTIEATEQATADVISNLEKQIASLSTQISNSTDQTVIDALTVRLDTANKKLNDAITSTIQTPILNQTT